MNVHRGLAITVSGFTVVSTGTISGVTLLMISQYMCLMGVCHFSGSTMVSTGTTTDVALQIAC